MTQSDPRPSIWVGHITLHVGDVQATKAFFIKLGMRDVAPEASVGILELRGGTHLLILPADDVVAKDAQASFDLMVDDVVRTHANCLELSMDPSPMLSGEFHTSFEIQEPGGHIIKVNSTHVSDLPV